MTPGSRLFCALCLMSGLCSTPISAQDQVGKPAGDPAPDPPKGARGSISDAVRNLQDYVKRQNEAVDAGAHIEFNAKGVDFGPWARGFSAQVQRNWVVTSGAVQGADNAVVAMKIQRDGTITDVQMKRPATLAALNVASLNAVTRSSPVLPLPSQYPDPFLLLTINFEYRPPAREFVFTGPAEFYPLADATTYEWLTQEQITKEGLRFFAVGAETIKGRQLTKVRVRPRVGTERVGWINKVPTEADFARASQPMSAPSGIIGAVVGGLPQAPPPPTPVGATVRVGGTIKPPEKTKHVDPEYPAIAQSARVQGVVIVEVLIRPDGKVNSARIVRSIPLLDQAALDAVRQWEFAPTLLNGAPVSVISTVTVQFALN
jgi:TonB family protein